LTGVAGAKARLPAGLQAAGLAALAAVGYFVAARLSYAFAIGSGSVTLWAPSGLTLALLLLNPSSRWVAIAAGAAAGSITSDLISQYRVTLAIWAAAANVCESLVAARVILALVPAPVTLASRRSVLAFAVGGAVAANALTALLGAAMLTVGFSMPMGAGWMVWWIGDGLGMLIVAPLLITTAHAIRSPSAWHDARRAEGAIVLTLVAIVSALALGPRSSTTLLAGPYMVMPFVFWAALRIGPPGAAAASVIVAAVGTWFTALGIGPFALGARSESNAALDVYLFLAVTSVSALAAAGAAEEQRLTAAQLRRSEERYRRAQKLEAVGKLAGGIAHDFNNILTVIQGHCDLAADEVPPGSPAADDLAQIRNAAARAGALTRQLLAFSRRQVMAPREVLLHEVLVALSPMLRRLIGMHVAIQISAKQTWPVLADVSQLEQVVVNLSVNARDAMPDGGTLTFNLADVVLSDEAAARLDVPPGDYVRMDVSDTGTGIDPAVMPHLFEPFVTTKGEGEGTGLGLATVHGIVKQTSGAIDVASEPGKGTTFSVYLPRLVLR
jgi:signal transduction histidine kinase